MYRWRFEAELGFRTNKAALVTNLTYAIGPGPAYTPTVLAGEVAATGSTSAISLMGNIMYDRYFQSGWMWMLGGGFGGARLNFDAGIDPGTTFAVPPAGAQLLFNKKALVPAFQVIVGIGYTWSEHIETAITYRYFYPLNSKYWAENTYISGKIIEFDPQYSAQTINLEIRFT
jgi:opacity protein-like surface antigen